MPAYHSVFLEEPNQQILGNISLLPLRTRTRGPAQPLPPLTRPDTNLTIQPDNPSYDPVDEVLSLFRANTFFRNFEIHGPADRTMIYGILFVGQLLNALPLKGTVGRREGEKLFNNLSLSNSFPIPGDASFPLNQSFEAPKDRQQQETLRQYFMQLRQEVASRLAERLWMEDENVASKWWVSFRGRKFMGRAL